MNENIKECLPPDRHPRKPDIILPEGSVDTHVHVFENRYVLSPDRGYTPPESNLAALKHLHSTLGLARVVFTQPSIYGTDNSAILDGINALNAETPNRARGVIAINMEVSDEELTCAPVRYPTNPPRTKEAYLYRSIFASHFPSDSAARCVPEGPSIACSTPVALEWDPNFAKMADPSGRAVQDVHHDSY